MDIMGSKLTAAREAAGLSMNALAKASGVSRTYISQLEKDMANNPSASKIIQLALTLLIPVSDLALDEPELDIILTEKGKEAVAEYRVRSIGGRKRTVRI